MEAVRVITGRAVPLVRSDVDTDQIIPSDWLKRVERTGFGAGLFSEWRENSDFVLNQERYDGANILVAGPNFGTGSSREHAVWALMDYGFAAVLSPRFADIFRNNSGKMGLVVATVDQHTVQRLWDAIEEDPNLELVDRRREQTGRRAGHRARRSVRARRLHAVPVAQRSRRHRPDLEERGRDQHLRVVARRVDANRQPLAASLFLIRRE